MSEKILVKARENLKKLVEITFSMTPIPLKNQAKNRFVLSLSQLQKKN